MFGLKSAKQVQQGRKKRNNEDYVTLFEPTDLRDLQASGCLYLLADGVGGAARGERASQYAADKVIFEYFEYPELEPSERLRRAIFGASVDIFSYASQSTRVTRMATTIIAAVIREDLLYVANVGDSRAYLIRAGQAIQLTRDHSVVGEMVADGAMTEEEAMASKIKNRLTRSVGGDAEVHVQLYDPLQLYPGDRILLCSDGLTRYANRQKVGELAAQGTPEEIAKRCIGFAKARGAADDISVITVAVGLPMGDAPSSDVVATSRPQMPNREFLEDAPTDPQAVRTPGVRSASRRAKPQRLRSVIYIFAVLVGTFLIGSALFSYLWLFSHSRILATPFLSGDPVSTSVTATLVVTVSPPSLTPPATIQPSLPAASVGVCVMQKEKNNDFWSLLGNFKMNYDPSKKYYYCMAANFPQSCKPFGVVPTLQNNPSQPNIQDSEWLVMPPEVAYADCKNIPGAQWITGATPP